MIRTSSAAAATDKPLPPQSKAPDVYSRIRDCVCNCKCDAIHFYQTCPGVDTKMWALLSAQGAKSDSVSIK